MRYLRCGAGPPLLMIHGLLGYSFSWRLNFKALAERRTVYAPDLVGAGFSERPANLDCTLRANASRLAWFLELLGITNCDVLGTSYGGAIAMVLAAILAEKRRGLVKRMILVAPVNPWSSHGRLLTRVVGSGLGANLFRRIAPYARTTHGYFLRRMYGDPRRITPGTLEGYSAALAFPKALDYGLKITSSWRADMQELQSALPKISDIPTLFLWGSRDRAVLPASASEVRRHFHNSQLVIFEGAGHLLYEEQPEEFNRAVLDFLVD
jgi:pimeloyl-ACP methyl ester carboxylesterase